MNNKYQYKDTKTSYNLFLDYLLSKPVILIPA